MAIAQLDKLKWSTVPPIDPSYYWIAEDGMQPHIVQVDIVSDSNGMLEVMIPSDDMKYSIETWKGALWCGSLESSH